MAFAALAVSSLAACVTTSEDGATNGGGKPDLVEERLQESGSRIAAALEQLARLQSASAPMPGKPVDVASAPENLREPVTWVWTGSAKNAVKGLARRIGYLARIEGREPASMPVVKIDAENTPLIKVIESIGLQLGARAVVRLDAGHKTISLVYTVPATDPGPRS